MYWKKNIRSEKMLSQNMVLYGLLRNTSLEKTTHVPSENWENLQDSVPEWRTDTDLIIEENGIL